MSARPRARLNAKPKPRKPRGPRGAGSIYPNRGGWRGKVLIGKKPDGKPHYVYRWARTQTALMEKLKAVRPPGPQTTVAEWAERWLASSTARGSTRADLRHTLDRFVIPSLGHIRLIDLTPWGIENAIRTWAKPAGTLSANTLRKNLGQLSTCLEAARRAKIIQENPAADARRPRPAKITIDPFTAEELARIIAADEAGIFALLAGVGCRIGEALALDVGDFSPATGEISITKTYDRRHGTRPPKSENGIRTVRIPKQALPAVKRAIGKRKTGPLFTNRHGCRREHQSTRTLFKRLLARLGIRYRKPHQLRHGVASVWVGRGVPLADVAAKLGDSLQMVVKTYVHPLGVDPTDALEQALSTPGKVAPRWSGT